MYYVCSSIVIESLFLIAHSKQNIGGLEVMARELKITKEYDSDLYDSATGKKCIPQKVVDISEDCPKVGYKDHCVFIYTSKEKYGRIVEISCSYKMGMYSYMRDRIFLDPLDDKTYVQFRDDFFGLWYRRLGLSAPELCTLIKTHAPAV